MGHARAQEALSESHSVEERLEGIRPSLLRYVLSRGVSADDAEELVQEAICRALTFGPERLGEALVSWLCRVASNLAVDDHRRKKRSEHALARYCSDTVVPDHAEQVVDADLGRCLRASLSHLSRPQREVLTAVSDGEALGDFAARRGCSIRSAEGHLRRARTCMRRWALTA